MGGSYRFISVAVTVFVLVALVFTGSFVILQSDVSAKKPDSPPGQSKNDNGNNYPETINLQDIDSGITSPTGKFRWMDVADHVYSSSYIDSYDYTQATIEVSFAPVGDKLEGEISASNLKPNFAYQVKLGGDAIAHRDANERIGFVGRWWRETWSGSEWSSGKNSNDAEYTAQHNVPYDGDGTPSQTGLLYKFTGYLVFDYFTTDSKGNASLEFRVNSSYHVLYKTSQRSPASEDGPVKTTTFRVNSKKSTAYDVNYGWVSVGVYGQVKHQPVGSIYPAPGAYDCSFFLTEESFHSTNPTYGGNWAAAMGAPISFEITE